MLLCRINPFWRSRYGRAVGAIVNSQNIGITCELHTMCHLHRVWREIDEGRNEKGEGKGRTEEERKWDEGEE